MFVSLVPQYGDHIERPRPASRFTLERQIRQVSVLSFVDSDASPQSQCQLSISTTFSYLIRLGNISEILFVFFLCKNRVFIHSKTMLS